MVPQRCPLCLARGLARSRASVHLCQWWGSLLITPSPQEEKEKRRLEQLERKKETQRLLEEEDSKLKGGKVPRVAAPSKVTRAQIEETLRRDHQHKEAPDPGGAVAHSGAAFSPSKGQAVGLTLAESRAPSSFPEKPPGLCGEAWVGSGPAGLALSTESMGTHTPVFTCSAPDLGLCRMGSPGH